MVQWDNQESVHRASDPPSSFLITQPHSQQWLTFILTEKENTFLVV